MTEVQNQYFTGKFEGDRKNILFYQSWRPVFCERAMVVVHGLGEHSGRYQNLIKGFSNDPVGVYGYDQRGHGRSKGQRGYVRSFLQLTNDLRHFLKLISVHENNKPIYLFAHSLGGLIALRYLIECDSRSGVLPSGVILSNPTYKISVKVPKWKELLSTVMSRLIPRLSLYNELDLRYLSRDPSVLEAVKQDLYCHQKIALRFYHEMLATIDFVKENCHHIRVPLFVMAGEKDGIVEAKGAGELFDGLQMEEKRLKIYPGMYHELINDIGKETVFQDIKDWIKHLEETKPGA